MADLYSQGFNRLLYKVIETSPADPVSALSGAGLGSLSNIASGSITDPVTGSTPASLISSGSIDQILYSKKTSFTDKTNGWRQGIDTDGVYKWIIGGTTNSIDWGVTAAGTLTVIGTITASAGTIGGFTITATTIQATNLVLTSGAANTANIAVGSGANSAGINSAAAAGDIAFWGGSTFAGRASAPFRVTAAGAITATSGTIGGWTLSATDLSSVSGGNTTSVSSGATSFSSGPTGSPTFTVTRAGALTATSGTIGGWTLSATQLSATGIVLDSSAQTITVGSSAPSITIDGVNKWIRTSTYASLSQGWTINKDGTAEFNNISARGEFHTQVLSYGSVHVTAGSSLLALSGGTLKADFTSVASPTTFNVDVNDPPTGHTQLFVVNDILRVKDGSGNDNWLTVSSVSDQTTFFRYVCTKSSGSNATFRAGAAIADYGQSGQGLIFSTVDAVNAPYISVQTHAGSPWSSTTERLRLGNLNGALDYASNVYGLAIGSSSGTNANITIEPTNGIRIRTGTTNILSFDNSGNANVSNTLTVGAAIIISTAGNIHSGQSAYNTGTGWWLEYNGGTPRLSIGDAGSNRLTWDGTALTATNVTVKGTLDINTSGVIKSGQSAYNTGTGYWLEYNGGTPRISIGDAGSNRLTWDGTTLTVSNQTVLGTLNISTSGVIKSGQSAYNTGTGYWLEYNGGTPRLSIGDGSANYLTWNGTTLSIQGALFTVNGAVLDPANIYGDGSDGALSISSGTTTLNTAGKSVYKYSSVSVTGTAVLKGGANLQNVFTIILVAGDLTITSSTSPAVDWSGLGGQGGSAGGVGTGGGAGTSGATNHIANGAAAPGLSGGNGDGAGGSGGGGYGNAGSNSAPADRGQNAIGGASNPFVTSFSLTRIMADLFLGGGGSGGSGDAFTGPGAGAAGANGGGGLLFIVKGNINITSTFTVAGNNGSNAPAPDGGGGGGGGGGFLGIWYGGSVTANTATLTVSGGSGGSKTGQGTAGASGGAGQSIVRKLTSVLGL